jgi:hypothetical protein
MGLRLIWVFREEHCLPGGKGVTWASAGLFYLDGCFTDELVV